MFGYCSISVVYFSLKDSRGILHNLDAYTNVWATLLTCTHIEMIILSIIC
jgi:hypothetical protein